MVMYLAIGLLVIYLCGVLYNFHKSSVAMGSDPLYQIIMTIGSAEMKKWAKRRHWILALQWPYIYAVAIPRMRRQHATSAATKSKVTTSDVATVVDFPTRGPIQ